jgi:hypothetical protein
MGISGLSPFYQGDFFLEALTVLLLWIESEKWNARSGKVFWY